VRTSKYFDISALKLANGFRHMQLVDIFEIRSDMKEERASVRVDSADLLPRTLRSGLLARHRVPIAALRLPAWPRALQTTHDATAAGVHLAFWQPGAIPVKTKNLTRFQRTNSDCTGRLSPDWRPSLDMSMECAG